MYCGNSAAVHWEEPHFTSPRKPDHDAVVCLTFLMLPLLPLRPCHVFDHTGGAAREVPLRWKGRLVARALLRPWLFLATGIGAWMVATLLFVLGYAYTHPKPWRRPTNPGFYAVLGIASLLPVGLLGLRATSAGDRRNRDIRLLMGRHAFGSSDPALWRPDVLRAANPEPLIGSSDIAGTAERELRQGHFPRAMLAARLLVAHGDPRGEPLTARILADPRVVDRLERIRKQPWRIAELVPEARPTAPQASALDGIPFYDGRRYPKAALDAAGGPGFGAFVRDNPRLVRAAPTHAPVKAALWALLLSFAYVGIAPTPPSKSKPDKPWERLLGCSMFCALFAWALRDAYTRKVTIGDGKLKVSNRIAHLDAVQKVGRRRVFGFPAVSVTAVDGLVEWPYRRGESEELERVLEAAIALRRVAPRTESGPVLESDGRAAHFRT
jgi:hypothetical protein